VNYPLTLRFKIVTLASKIEVLDANGNLVCFVKQKMFKLKEHVTVFADQAMTQPLCDITADRVLDFSANYTFTTPDGGSFGSISRRGMRSLWRCHYEVRDAAQQTIMVLREENPWAKVLDSILSDIPILGLFSGYMVHPKYLYSTPVAGPPAGKNKTPTYEAGEPALFRVTKQPAFLEGVYLLEELAPMPEEAEWPMLMGTIMMVLLERSRG